MELQINSQPIQFEIEHERTVAEVMASVANWAKERSLIFTEAWIDDKNYPVDDIPDITLDRVSTINCVLQSNADIILSTMQEAMEYCAKIIAFIDETSGSGNHDASMISELRSGIEWVKEVMEKVRSLLGIDPAELKYRDSSAAQIMGALGELTAKLAATGDAAALEKVLGESAPLFESVQVIFRQMALSIEMRDMILASIESPDVLYRSLMEITEVLPEQLKLLETIAISYQSGKDNLGSQHIQVFVDFIYKYLRTCYQVVPVFGIKAAEVVIDGISLEEKNQSINSLLGEILNALETNDIISLADILEYEMRPLLENLGGYCEEMMQQMKSRP